MTTVKLLIIALYNLTILSGTAYLCVVHDWSEWTFILAIALLATSKSGADQEKNLETEKVNS